MSEEATMLAQDETESYIAAYNKIPYSVISNEISADLKNDFYRELNSILKYYQIYDAGADFHIEGTNGDYVGSNVHYRKCRDLINKEARFLFSIPPTVQINKDIAHTSQEKTDATILNDYVAKVFKKNGMSEKLVKAAKDCFIGKRVGCILNFNPEFGISITFLKSYEFIYERNAAGDLQKFIAFYITLDSSTKKEQRIKKKSYEMKGDVCYTHEVIYNGLGEQIEEPTPETATNFNYIPAAVIINDGLSNDSKGESEIEQIGDDMEGLYSKLANADIDASRKSMNAIRYAIDASAESTADLSTAPGAFWDIKSNPITPDPKTAQVGMMEPSMHYSQPLKTTLDRINNQMHSQVDVPDINSEQLQGVITSGKTLKALYWGLSVRCDEKMLAWEPALEYIIKAIIDGGILYPEAAKYYTEKPLPDIELDICIQNPYPLLEDSNEEKTMDLAEVQSMTMSRKAYMKKWRELTDEEVDDELRQILLEKQLFEDSMVPMDMGSEENENEDEETLKKPESDGEGLENLEDNE